MIVPITEEVSVDHHLISLLSALAIPNPFEFIPVLDKLIDQAADETFNPELPYKENEKLTEVRYFQLLWNLLLEKGRDNNV